MVKLPPYTRISWNLTGNLKIRWPFHGSLVNSRSSGIHGPFRAHFAVKWSWDERTPAAGW